LNGGEACDRAVVSPGDVVHLRRQLVLPCVRREPLIPAAIHFQRAAWGSFGEADTLGVLGESPATDGLPRILYLAFLVREIRKGRLDGVVR